MWNPSRIIVCRHKESWTFSENLSEIELHCERRQRRFFLLFSLRTKYNLPMQTIFKCHRRLFGIVRPICVPLMWLNMITTLLMGVVGFSEFFFCWLVDCQSSGHVTVLCADLFVINNDDKCRIKGYVFSSNNN